MTTFAVPHGGTSEYSKQAPVGTAGIDPDFIGMHQILTRWGHNVTNDKGILVIITPPEVNIGAPARFVPSIREVHVTEAAFRRNFVPGEILTIIDFIKKYPALAGMFVHEFCHARCSPSMKMIGMAAREVGDPRARDALTLLLEGHAEANGWPVLTDIEKAGLRATVLDLVLEDVLSLDDEEDGPAEGRPLTKAAAVSIIGLIAGRCEAGIIDRDDEAVNRMIELVRERTGEPFDALWQTAHRASKIEGRERYKENPALGLALAAEVKEWLRLVDEVEDDPGDEGGRKPPPGPGEDEEPGGSEEGGTQGTPSDDEDAPDGPSEDGDGGDGAGPSPGETGGESGHGPGRYGSMDSSLLPEEEPGGPIRSIARDLADAADRANEAYRKEARIETENVRRATAQTNAKRRSLNNKYARRWSRS